MESRLPASLRSVASIQSSPRLAQGDDLRVGEHHKTRAERKKDFEDKTKSDHWLNNAGYMLYAGVGAIKQIGVLQRAVSNDNPTLMLGLTTLLASYPPVFFSHNLYAKLMMMIAFHTSEMAESAVNYNTFIGDVMVSAKEKNISLTQPKLSGLTGMKEWMNKGFFARIVTGKATAQDKQHIKAFNAYVVNDFKQAGTQLGQSFKAFGELGVESLKTVVTLGKHKFNVPERLKLLPSKTPSQYNLNARQNIYHLENAGAFSGLLGVLAETVGHAFGLHQYTRLATVPWLMSANAMQTIGLGATAKTIWNTGPQAKYKWMAASEGTGAALCAIGAASWSSDALLGIYRLGSALQTPFRMYQRYFEVDAKGNSKKMAEADLTKDAKLARNWDWITLGVDVLSAGAIIGSPFVAAYEAKHHTDLRKPENWKQLFGKKKKEPHPVVSSPAIKHG
jgi:hypothetical protein